MIFWPDLGRLPADHPIWKICQVLHRDEPEFDTGQIVIDKARSWKPLQLAMHLNEWSDFYYQHIHGDKETFHLAWRKIEQPCAIAPPLTDKNWLALYHHDFSGRRIFQHRSHCKWLIAGEDVLVDDFRYHDECVAILNELRAGFGYPNATIHTAARQKLPLSHGRSASDALMLTAAVRDLHRTYPGRFLTDVRTTEGAMWESNPYITSIDDTAADVRTIVWDHPPPKQQRLTSRHFSDGFIELLNSELSIAIIPTERKADLHLSRQEKTRLSQVQEIIRSPQPIPFWIVAASGKDDTDGHESTLAQRVVDHFHCQLLFVQVGEPNDHPPLRHVLDMRGKTDLRQLIHLVHHADGVLCGQTLLMHLAAAVETHMGRWDRPCVVVAGKSESLRGEAYAGHEVVRSAPSGGVRIRSAWKT